MSSKLTVAKLRDLEKQVNLGEISYSHMVELINEIIKPSTNLYLDIYYDNLLRRYSGNKSLKDKNDRYRDID